MNETDLSDNGAEQTLRKVDEIIERIDLSLYGDRTELRAAVSDEYAPDSIFFFCENECWAAVRLRTFVRSIEKDYIGGGELRDLTVQSLIDLFPTLSLCHSKLTFYDDLSKVWSSPGSDKGREEIKRITAKSIKVCASESGPLDKGPEQVFRDIDRLIDKFDVSGGGDSAALGAAVYDKFADDSIFSSCTEECRDGVTFRMILHSLEKESPGDTPMMHSVLSSFGEKIPDSSTCHADLQFYDDYYKVADAPASARGRAEIKRMTEKSIKVCARKAQY